MPHQCYSKEPTEITLGYTRTYRPGGTKTTFQRSNPDHAQVSLPSSAEGRATAHYPGHANPALLSTMIQQLQPKGPGDAFPSDIPGDQAPKPKCENQSALRLCIYPKEIQRHLDPCFVDRIGALLASFPAITSAARQNSSRSKNGELHREVLLRATAVKRLEIFKAWSPHELHQSRSGWGWQASDEAHRDRPLRARTGGVEEDAAPSDEFGCDALGLTVLLCTSRSERPARAHEERGTRFALATGGRGISSTGLRSHARSSTTRASHHRAPPGLDSGDAWRRMREAVPRLRRGRPSRRSHAIVRPLQASL
jgi:hypothetical protein